MTSNDSFSPLAIFFFLFYGTVFVVSFVGNTWVLVTCYRNLNRNQFSLMWYVANLASSDLLFTFLTPFNAISFAWRWVGGNTTCKLQGFLIETSYTTSITTLVVISHLRLKAVTDPLNSRSGRFSNREYTKLVIIWSICLVICSPIAHIYRVEADQNGKLVCTNTTWGSIGRQIYYTLHAVFFFIIPLIYIIVTQQKISRSLKANVIPIGNSHIMKSNQRQKRVAKTLVALSLAFVLCWTSFMILRTLMYFDLASPGLGWRAAQLMIFLNTALDPLLYGYYGGNLKSKVCSILRCNYQNRLNPESIASTPFHTSHSLGMRETHEKVSKN